MIRRGFSLFALVVMALSAVVVVEAQSLGTTGKATAAAVASSPGKTASSPPAGTTMAAVPKDAKELMVLAAKTNGLAGLEDRPWHLKANYQIFDPDGKPEQSGVYEEWWAGPKKYKVSYTSADFNQTIYMSAGGRVETGNQGWPSMQVDMARRFLLRPLPSADLVAKLGYKATTRKMGQVKMQCEYPKTAPEWLNKDAEKSAKPGGMGLEVPQTCFNKGMAAVRVEIADSGLVAVFNQVVDAGGQYVAKEIEIGDGGVPLVNLSVTALEFPASIPEAKLAAPAGAAKDSPLAVRAGVMAGHRIGGEAVKYPMVAKEKRVQGLVILEAMIDRMGKVADLKMIAGQKLLRDAAAQAVKTWTYTPYLLNGKPVPVRTQINVIFTLGG